MKPAHILFGLLVSLATACSFSQEPVPFQGSSATASLHRIRQSSYPALLKGVTYRATATYHYDSLNRLTRIDSAWSDRSYLYKYANNRLAERLTVSVANGAVFFREMFEYDATGRLVRKLFTGNGTTIEYLYDYQPDGLMAGVQITLLSSTYKRSTSYYWENGNITRLTEWNSKGEKDSEWSYQHDNKPNILALLSVSPNPDDAFSMNRNNTVYTKLERDYSGLIDLAANPNRPTFIYNADGLLVKRLWNYDNRYEEFVYERKQ